MMRRKMIVGVGVGALLLVSMPHTLSPVLRQKEKPAIESRKATWEEKKANKELAKRIAWQGYGWRKMEWNCLDYIFIKESKYDHLARNRQGSSAFGIGQRLKETSKDPLTQILHTYKYIQHRYKTPCEAMKFHLRHNYY
jgi:hypothetical protein